MGIKFPSAEQYLTTKLDLHTNLENLAGRKRLNESHFAPLGFGFVESVLLCCYWVFVLHCLHSLPTHDSPS